MDGNRMAALAQRGYGISGLKAGLPHDHYRPTDANAPLSFVSRLGVLMVATDRDAAFPFRGGPKHGEAVVYGLLDGTRVEHGDYLVSGSDGAALFVARAGAIHATTLVRCNAVLTLRRPAAPGVGMVGYRTEIAGETVLFTDWPAAITIAGRSGSAGSLPADLPAGEWTILLPNVPGLPPIRNADALVNETGRRFGVKAAEATDLGWRIAARTEMVT